jgi:hypothetical protein
MSPIHLLILGSVPKAHGYNSPCQWWFPSIVPFTTIKCSPALKNSFPVIHQWPPSCQSPFLTSQSQSIGPSCHYGFWNEPSLVHYTLVVKLPPSWLPFQLQHF